MATPRTLPTSSAVGGLGRWQAGLMTAFAGTGVGVATWVTRTPAIRDALGATTAEMGLVIAGLSVGSILGISLGGLLVARRGARFVVVGGMTAIVAGMVVIAVGAATGQSLVVATGLAFFGYGMGSGEIGNNVSGVELEVSVGRSVVPTLHGCFSLGTVVGALAGLVANHVALPVAAHLGLAAALVGAGTVWLSRQVPAGTGRVERGAPGADDQPAGEPEPRFAWLDARLVGLGVIILGMALAEGSASDWLPLIVVDGYGSTAVLGSVIYAFFGAAMALGRLSGGRLIDRFGRAPVMRTSSLVAAAGIGVVVVAPDLVVAAAGVLLWGLGASLGFPVALSAAGDDPRHAARRATAVATAGYAAFLVGPPVLGLLGEHVGLRDAMVVVLVAVLATTFAAGAVRPRPAPVEPLG
ncbi:MFS transporter [Microlunatus capsulatus]